MSEALVQIRQLRAKLESICRSAEQLESELAGELGRVHPKLRESARNLVCYMALRHRDLRQMQRQLEFLGLSSLGRAELHTKSSIETVAKALGRLYLGESGDMAPQKRDFILSEAALAIPVATAPCASWSRCRAKRPSVPG